MRVGHKLEFTCQKCNNPVLFSVLDSEHFDGLILCPQCGKKYAFGNETMVRHLRLFEALCRQIHASQEILGRTSIAINVGPHHVEVPYRLLLTRFSSIMELMIGDQKVNIAFRVEPLRDVRDLQEASAKIK
jgi:NAD-dependent SIR2 family protein deacetylase